MRTTRAVLSTYHLLLKFPTKEKVGEVRGDQIMARESYLTAVRGKQKAKETFNVSLNQAVEQKQVKVEPAKGIVKVNIDKQGRMVSIGSQMQEEVNKNVTEFLYSNYGMMVYNPIDMERVSRKVIKYSLNVKNDAKAVKQKKRNFASDRQE